ncbi:hypothetical protein [Sanyastnella coralliicola]|uniref:hypothetical protein n=1 Tax=Sanyastnella coralliicola TaxID=3069118 RepID=UPI0027B9BCBE|nr:hypothetical protein [Longitalea sp. SCSIO 12813]
MKFTLHLLVILFAVGGMMSCQKYEENPRFVFSSKKARLCQEWNHSDFQVNGTDRNNYVIAWEFEFDRDGGVIESRHLWSGLLPDDQNQFTRLGNWEWIDSKRSIRVTFDDGEVIDYEIQKLVEEELHFDTLVEGENGLEKWEYKFYSN